MGTGEVKLVSCGRQHRIRRALAQHTAAVTPTGGATVAVDSFTPVVLFAGTSHRFPVGLTVAEASDDPKLMITVGGSFGTRTAPPFSFMAVKP